jgi:hypothetical protein
MRLPKTISALVVGLTALGALPAGAQTAAPRTLSDAECQALRDRVADHARLSEAVRRAVATRVAANPAPVPPPAAPPPTASGGRAAEIRTRLERIKVERQQAEDGRLGAVTRFDLGQAARMQAQMTALDQEKADLERELARLPATATTTPATTPAAAPAPPRDADRLRCQDVAATHDEAVRIRQKELGAKEGQVGAIPLVPPKSQTPADGARELAAQMPDGPNALVGLLDSDGNGQLDGFVDVPARGVYRVHRQQAGGGIRVEVPGAPASGAPYGEIPRRIDEASAQHGGRTLADLLATRPAGPVRVTAETPDWAAAWGQWLAGNYADAARLERPALRSLEHQNVRGEAVRVVEVLAPTGAGVTLRRIVAVATGPDREQWEETATTVRPLSVTRVEVEVSRAQETRTMAGAAVGARTTAAPARFTVER